MRNRLTVVSTPSCAPSDFLAGGQAQHVLPFPDQPDGPALGGKSFHG